MFDKTPIPADDKTPASAVADDDFGGFDDDEDAEYIQRAKRNAMRKRGLDPKALEQPKAAKSGGKSEGKGSEVKGSEVKGSEVKGAEVKAKTKTINGSKAKKSKSKSSKA